MMHLLMAHPGAHVNPDTLSALPLIFRRAIAAVRRKPAAPEVPSTPSGAATALLADAEPVMRDRMLSEVRAEHNTLSGAELAALRPRKVLPRADGDIVIDERERVHVRPVSSLLAGDLPRRVPGATLPYAEPLVDRGPGHPPWPTQEMPAYGQAPVARVLEAERLAGAMLP